jgi:hypothetical protein
MVLTSTEQIRKQDLEQYLGKSNCRNCGMFHAQQVSITGADWPEERDKKL